MNEQQQGAVRLWQAVAIQALLDASHANPSSVHRFEARAFVASKTFEAICEQTNLNGRFLRNGVDDPRLFSRLRAFLGGPQRGVREEEGVADAS